MVELVVAPCRERESCSCSNAFVQHGALHVTAQMMYSKGTMADVLANKDDRPARL